MSIVLVRIVSQVFFSLSPSVDVLRSRVTKQALLPPPPSASPLPTTKRAFIFIFIASAFFSLVDSNGIAPTHAARRSQQLIPFILDFCKM